jgi:hypothetical protein
MLVESLDRRHLLAADIAHQLNDASLFPEHEIAEQSTAPQRFSASVIEARRQADDSRTRQVTEVAEQAVQFGQQTFAPENWISGFRKQTPDPNSLQQQLTGASLSGPVDLSSLASGSTQAIATQETEWDAAT